MAHLGRANRFRLHFEGSPGSACAPTNSGRIWADDPFVLPAHQHHIAQGCKFFDQAGFLSDCPGGDRRQVEPVSEWRDRLERELAGFLDCLGWVFWYSVRAGVRVGIWNAASRLTGSTDSCHGTRGCESATLGEHPESRAEPAADAIENPLGLVQLAPFE